MQFLKNHQALVEKVNEAGRLGTPFFLFVDFAGEQPLFFSPGELHHEDIQVDFPGYKTKTSQDGLGRIELKKQPVDFETYRKKFNLVKYHLQRGNTFLTNLTGETTIETGSSLEEIYNAAKAKYKIGFKDEWVCFSPETFVQIVGSTIRSFPMKGTIDASLPDAENLLMNDPKEIAEHYTIVDLIRNDLSRVAANVEVKRFRYIDKIITSGKTLLQVSSQIEGQLPEKFRDQLGVILFSLLPAGSISGAPKKKTVEIIQEAEQYQRGFYTGVAFYFDGKDVDSCVLIRFIEKKQTENSNQLVYKSGGGITFHSEVEKEFQELNDKIYVPCF